MIDDKRETKRTVGRPKKLIPPILAPFKEVLKAVATPVEKPGAPPES
jgi:hypothetical protein